MNPMTAILIGYVIGLAVGCTSAVLLVIEFNKSSRPLRSVAREREGRGTGSTLPRRGSRRVAHSAGTTSLYSLTRRELR
jgi:hypothetical protein